MMNGVYGIFIAMFVGFGLAILAGLVWFINYTAKMKKHNNKLK